MNDLSDPSDPVRPRPTPSDPVRPVRPRPTPSDPVRPVRPRPTPSDPVRPRPTPSDPVRPVRPRPTPSDPVRPRPTPSDPVRPRPTRPTPSDPVRPRPTRPTPSDPSDPVRPRNFFHFLARTTFRGGGPLTVGWAKALFASLKFRVFLENFKQESCTIIDKHRQSSKLTTHWVIRMILDDFSRLEDHFSIPV
jgi:hypothetical protein